MIHEDMKRFFDGYPGTAHPMAILSAMVLSLSSFYPQALDVKNKEEQEATIARLLSKMRTIAAFSYKKSIGQPFVYPKNSLRYCANFLNMMFSVPAEPYEMDEDIVQGAEPAADPARRPRAELQHVDGAPGRQLAGQPVRVDLGRHLRALGPAARRRQRGGAEMLEAIQDDGSGPKKFIDLAKDKDSGFRLMGFGHRVYKNFDPRAKIIKVAADKVLSEDEARPTRCSTSPRSWRRRR